MEFTSPPVFNATPFRISTITATGGISSEVDLAVLFGLLKDASFDEVKYIEYGMNKHDLQTSGINSKSNRSSAKKKLGDASKKRFDNQLTVVLHLEASNYNMKLFKNGNVQITGVKNIEKGSGAVDFLVRTLRTLHERHPESGLLKRPDALANANYRVRLINSDFKVNFEIRLDRLFSMITREYDIMCSYEPCIYPGAKIEYYYPNNGRCTCDGVCNGKSDRCKKITIAVFQSGCVIITGANCMEHIHAAYGFVCDVMRTHLGTIFRHRIKPSIKSVA